MMLPTVPFPTERPFVYIMGSGPGDPSLLSIKAYRILTEVAEVIIYDRLISPAILDLIPPHVERVFAGKEAKHHYMPQDDIHQTMLQFAQQKKIIVRLKGGDPFIFGRGGEEMLFLANQQISFDIVPGITAAEGCAAAYGIPLTHRGIAHGVRFITGHQQDGRLEYLDWSGLADPSTTLVIYMGLANLSIICEQLMVHGLSHDSPLAFIQNGTLPNGRLVISTVSQAAEDVQRFGISAPSLIIIGDVVRLAKV